MAVRHPPTSGARAGNLAAVEVQITQVQPLFLAGLFLADPPMISTRAVAMLQDRSVACLLALTGPVTIQNSSSFNAAGCAVASNATTAAAINIRSQQLGGREQDDQRRDLQRLHAGQRASGAGLRGVAAPVTNGYANLDTKAAPTVTTCLNTAQLNVSGPLVAYTTTLRQAYCGNVTVANTSSVTFPSGTYVFRNASLTIGSISSFTCLSCTLLFVGSSPGRLSISNMSTAQHTAPVTNSIDADYNGLAVYRASSGPTGSAATPTLNLQSVSSFDLAGGIYFPEAYIRIGNVSSASNANCLPIVGGTLDIGNLSSFRFEVSNCAAYGTHLSYQQVARLVE